MLDFHSERHRETPVDVFATEPFDFAAELSQALEPEIAPGVPMRIVRLETLRRMKRQAGGLQDRADIVELIRMHPGG